MALLSLIGRVLVVIIAFLVACFAAAAVITLGIFIAEWNEISMMDSHAAWSAVGLFGFVLSGFGMLPAFMVIVLAESFGIRSVFFYAGMGALGLLALTYGVAFDEGGAIGARAAGRNLEIMAAAGIVAGFVYWAIAGRNAGRWYERRTATPPAPPEQPGESAH
jgi:hypothetical protein